MRRIAIALVLISACKKSEDKPSSAAPPPSTTGSASSSAAATPAPSADKPLPRIECDKVIPASAVETYFKGATPKHDEPFVDETSKSSVTLCRFILDPEKNRKVLINYNCGPDFASLDEYLGLLEKQISAKFERIPGVGRGGYKIGTSTVGAQHRTLPCMISADLSFLDPSDPERTKDWMPLIKELEAAVPDAP